MPATSRTVTPAQAEQLLAETAVALDVRTPGEFATTRIAGAVNIPLDQVDARRIAGAADRTLVLVCQSGPRAEQAAGRIAEGGYDDVVVLAGGMGAWEAEGRPVERAAQGQEKWAMERQVRLVAGSIALTSVLASTVFPKAKWGAAFIGGGLTFAAVSNTCMMANALSRLPYNQGPGADVDGAVEQLRAGTRASA